MHNSSSPHSPPSEHAELTQLKHKYEQLEAQLAVSKSLEPTIKSVKAVQISSGRAVRRIVDMFASPRDLVQENDRHAEAAVCEDEIESSAETREDTMFRSYHILVKQVPLIKVLVDSSDATALEALYTNLHMGSDHARGDDASNLKGAVVTWVNNKYGPSFPTLRANSKDERGIGNDNTGRLLRPVEYNWEDESYVVRTLIRDGNVDYPVTAQDWPACCYPFCTCDPNDIEKGLFCGPMLVKAFKFLLTSPSSVADDTFDTATTPPTKHLKSESKKPAATHSNVVTLIGLNSVTSRSIAYVAVQLRFSLSNASTWKTEDSQFDNMEFYYAIVNYFDVTPGPCAEEHIKELLAWWNVQVFGCSHGVPQAPGHRESSSVLKVVTQRRNRELEAAGAD